METPSESLKLSKRRTALSPSKPPLRTSHRTIRPPSSTLASQRRVQNTQNVSRSCMNLKFLFVLLLLLLYVWSCSAGLLSPPSGRESNYIITYACGWGLRISLDPFVIDHFLFLTLIPSKHQVSFLFRAFIYWGFHMSRITSEKENIFKMKLCDKRCFQ